jgi:hypothetical protein
LAAAWQLIHLPLADFVRVVVVVVLLAPGFVVVAECRAFRHDAQGNVDGPSTRKASRFESIKERIWLDKVRGCVVGLFRI